MGSVSIPNFGINCLSRNVVDIWRIPYVVFRLMQIAAEDSATMKLRLFTATKTSFEAS